VLFIPRDRVWIAFLAEFAEPEEGRGAGVQEHVELAAVTRGPGAFPYVLDAVVQRTEAGGFVADAGQEVKLRAEPPVVASHEVVGRLDQADELEAEASRCAGNAAESADYQGGADVDRGSLARITSKPSPAPAAGSD